MIRWLIVLMACLVGCESVVPGEGSDINLGKTEMRHGWKIFTGPERTVVDVNDMSSVSRGQALYRKNCQGCHGPKGQGDGPVAKAKGIKPANLQKLARKAPNYYLYMQIQEGKSEMPQWKDVLTPKQSWDLTNYIQSLSDGKEDK